MASLPSNPPQHDTSHRKQKTFHRKRETLQYCEGLIVSVHTGYTRHACTVGLDHTVAVSFQPVSSLLLEQHFQLITDSTLVSWKLVAMTCLCGHGDLEIHIVCVKAKGRHFPSTRCNQPPLDFQSHPHFIEENDYAFVC